MNSVQFKPAATAVALSACAHEPARDDPVDQPFHHAVNSTCRDQHAFGHGKPSVGRSVGHGFGQHQSTGSACQQISAGHAVAR
jgi:hypothetical protein